MSSNKHPKTSAMTKAAIKAVTTKAIAARSRSARRRPRPASQRRHGSGSIAEGPP